MKRLARSGVIAAMLVGVVHLEARADLKFTLHTELNHVAGATPNDWSILVSALAGKAIPPGGVDHLVLVNDTAMRMEQKQAFAGLAAGVITLFRDGQQIGIDPAARTFWKSRALSSGDLQAMSANKPDVQVKRTGETQTITGMRAERVMTTVTLKGMADAIGSTIGGMPKDPVLTLDVWVTEAVKVPAGWVPLIDKQLLDQLGLAHVQVFTDNKFLLRAVARVNFIPDFEIVMHVRDLVNESAPASAFEIPAGFTEVPPPANRGGGY